MPKPISFFIGSYLLACLATAPATDSLSWLTGRWKLSNSKGITFEEWHVANDSTLMGRSYRIPDGGDTVLQETIELAFRGGRWYYIPTAVGQNNDQPVSFPVIFLRGTEFIAENPDHDFPQRISYRLVNGMLLASIEGRVNGGFRKANFDFSAEK